MHRNCLYHAIPSGWLLLFFLVLLPPQAIVLAFFAHPPPTFIPVWYAPQQQLQQLQHTHTCLWFAAIMSTSDTTHDLPLLDDVRRMHPRELCKLLTENKEDLERLHTVGLMLTEEISRLRNQVWMEQLSRKVTVSRAHAMATKWQVKAVREETKALSTEIRIERLKNRVRFLETTNKDLVEELGWIGGGRGEDEKGGGRSGWAAVRDEEEREGDVDDFLKEKDEDESIVEEEDKDELEEEDDDQLVTEEEEEDELEAEALTDLDPEMEGEEEVGAVARGVEMQAEGLIPNVAEEEAVIKEEGNTAPEGACYPGMEHTDHILENLERLAQKLEE